MASGRSRIWGYAAVQTRESAHFQRSETSRNWKTGSTSVSSRRSHRINQHPIQFHQFQNCLDTRRINNYRVIFMVLIPVHSSNHHFRRRRDIRCSCSLFSAAFLNLSDQRRYGTSATSLDGTCTHPTFLLRSIICTLFTVVETWLTDWT